MTTPLDAAHGGPGLLSPIDRWAKAERATRRRAVLRRAAIVVALALGLGAFQAIREVSRSELSLAEDDTAGARVVTSVLEPGLRLRIPVEPNTDVVRLVVHAFGERSGVTLHTARLSFEATGSEGSSRETVEVPAPGTSGRAEAEDASVVVFDPIAVNLDVHGIGSGELVATLESVAGARGLLVRSYRRETVPVIDAIRRRTNLGESKRERLARRAGGADWVDLDATDRLTLLGARWRRLAPLPDSEQRATWKTITLRAAPARPASPTPQASGGGSGEAPSDREVAVRYYRVTPARPLVVASSGPPLVLRLGARRPGPPDGTERTRISLGVAFTKAQSPAIRTTLRADVSPTSVDRYEPPEGADTPSGRAVFHLVVPAAGSVSISSAEGPVDVVLSELDPDAPPRPLHPGHGDSGRESGAEPPELTWSGFVARRPSNAGDFTPELTGILRLAPRPVDAKRASAGQFAVAHAARPAGVSSIHRDGYTFVSSDAPVSIDVRGDRAVFVPMRLFSDVTTEVIVRVDGGNPERRTAFTPRIVTTTRSVHVDDDTHATLVLGDDLSPGKHVLSFESKAGSPVWVHLPWIRGSGRERPSGWVSGEFDP